MKNGMLVLLALIVSCTAYSQDTTDVKFGNGLLNVVSKDGSWSMKFGLRFQTLFIGENSVHATDGIGAGSSQFLIRRSRLKFNGHAFSPKLKYKVELGLSNRDIGKVNSTNNWAPNVILDAVLQWKFYKNFELWAGQTKLPGNRERVISSANMQFVDRSLVNSRYNIDRDMGVQLRHNFTIGKSFLVKEVVAISQGEGRNVVQENLGGLQYTGRVELLPFGKFGGKGDYIGAALYREETPKLSIAATYDYNDRAVKTRSNQGSYMVDASGDNNDGFFHSNISTVFADLMFKYKGLSIMGEYALRGADVVNHVGSDTTSSATVQIGSGFNVAAGWLFKNNWEVAARYTQINPDNLVGGGTEAQYTLGASRYIVGNALKVQADVSYLTETNNVNSNLMYRLQIDIHF